jgi:HAD superfamily hydrolase (TIGR01509 family)
MKGVIFDMDGVLIDSEPLHAELLIALAAEEGIQMSLDDTLKYIGIPLNEMWEELCAEKGLADSAARISSEHSRRTDEAFRSRDLVPVEGIPALLEELRREGYSLGVASSSESALIDLLLRKLGLSSFFSVTAGRDQVERGKPAPDIYLRTLELLGLESGRAAAVEDSAPGAAAALRAGLDCIGYQNPDFPHQDLAACDLLVPGFNEAERLKIRSFLRRPLQG